MTKDLEETLTELGPEYRAVVARVRDAYVPAVVEFAASNRRGRVVRWTVGYLLAASLMVVVALAVLLRNDGGRPALPARTSDAKLVYALAYAPSAESLAEIVRTQNADGSWANDFLTRQNAAALRRCDDAAAKLAYRKSVRYLRTRGLVPLTDGELRARGDAAARALAKS